MYSPGVKRLEGHFKKNSRHKGRMTEKYNSRCGKILAHQKDLKMMVGSAFGLNNKLTVT